MGKFKSSIIFLCVGVLLCLSMGLILLAKTSRQVYAEDNNHLKTEKNTKSDVLLQGDEESIIPMNIGDSLVVNKSKVFRYNLTVGERYEVYVLKTDHATFDVDIEVTDGNGQLFEVTTTNEVYSFTAQTAVVYVKLTMRNVGGQAGLYRLIKEGFNEESKVQNIIPEELYEWTAAEDHYMKIPAGEYKLYIRKMIPEFVRLYEIENNEMIEVVDGVETTSDHSAIKYKLTLAEEKMYCIISDASTVGFMLSYSQNGAYKIMVEGAADDDEHIYTNRNYRFALYRCVGDTKTLVYNVPDSDIYVQGISYNTIRLVNGWYRFAIPDRIIVTIYFWGIEAGASYVVVPPEIVIDVSDETGDLYFNSVGCENVDPEWQFESVTVIVIGTGATIYQETYFSSTISFNASDYIWYKNIRVKFIYNYSYEGNEFSIEGIADYYVVSSSIETENIDYGNNSIYMIEAYSWMPSMAQTIRIPASVKSIYFLGTSGYNFQYLDISAQPRDTALKVNFNNFNYYFKSNGIYADFSSAFTINVTGNCSIMPRTLDIEGEYGIYARNLTIEGTGKLSVAAGKRESSGVYAQTNGYAGINANNLTVFVKELYVKGGTGGDAPNASGTMYFNELRGQDANPGGRGGNAIWISNNFKVMSSCEKITMEGGNGGNGGNGANGLAATADFATGGRGGNGGDGGLSGGAFHQNDSQSELYFSSSTTKVITEGISGNGGLGGNGGDGGRGGKGGNGGRGGDGYVGGLGGNGGNGGNGLDDTSFAAKPSNGGDGGNGGHGGYSDYSGKYERPGNGGSGGNGGDPGGVGGGLNGGNGGYGYKGGRGGNGSSSHVIFATGGNGGDGGDGYGGSVGIGGSAGKGIWASDGSSGANSTLYKNYQDYPQDNN